MTLPDRPSPPHPLPASVRISRFLPVCQPSSADPPNPLGIRLSLLTRAQPHIVWWTRGKLVVPNPLCGAITRQPPHVHTYIHTCSHARIFPYPRTHIDPSPDLGSRTWNLPDLRPITRLSSSPCRLVSSFTCDLLSPPLTACTTANSMISWTVDSTV